MSRLRDTLIEDAAEEVDRETATHRRRAAASCCASTELEREPTGAGVPPGAVGPSGSFRLRAPPTPRSLRFFTAPTGSQVTSWRFDGWLKREVLGAPKWRKFSG